MSTINDGRKSMNQDIEHVRVNNPDHLAADGEFIDNEMDWGRATKGGITFYRGKTYYFGNGGFDYDQFPNSWTQTKDSTMERYSREDNPEKLGKFNAGSTESIFLTAEKGVMYHNFGGKVQKTTLDLDKVRRENKITPNRQAADEGEVEEFLSCMKMIDPKYTLETHANVGTLVKAESLIRPNNEKRIDEVKRFLYGLVHDTREHKCTWSLYNMLDGNYHEPIIIEPTNMGIGAPYSERIFHAVNHFQDSERREYIEDKDKKKIKGREILYSIKARIYFLEEQHLAEEKKIFGVKKGQERVGYHVYRGGRKLTGINPKLWNIGTGESRAKGTRIELLCPVCDDSDADLNVGTFKKITDDSWGFFHSDLQDLLEDLFTSINNEREKVMKQKRQEYANEYKMLSSELSDTMTIEELTSIFESAVEKLSEELKSKKIIVKKAGIAYSAHVAYIKSINSLIESKKESQAEDSSESQGEEGSSREPTPEPEPVREPTPDPVREPTPDPVREPTPEPVREPSREPTPDESQKQENTDATDSEQVTDYDSNSEIEELEPEPERENMISIDAAFALLRSEFESVIKHPLKQSVFEDLLREHREVLEKFRF